jgi:predicted Fe-Mo cluster-binding NifX family protein
MKIAVSATQSTLDSSIDIQFGRASYFLIVDENSFKYEVIQNPNKMVVGGAGILSAQLVIEKGVRTVITGNCGSNAFRVLKAAGIKIYENIEGSAKRAIQAYKTNQLKLAQDATDLPRLGKINV